MTANNPSKYYPLSGGQFEPVSTGQFEPAKGGANSRTFSAGSISVFKVPSKMGKLYSF